MPDEAANPIPAADGDGRFSAWMSKAKRWFRESPVPGYVGSALAGAFAGVFLTKLKYERS